MSQSLQRRKTPALGLLVFMVFALVLVTGGAAFGEGAPYKEVPGYPKYGCYDIVVGGHGMWSGYTPYPLSVDVPGPVVDAYLVWLGTADTNAAVVPDQSNLMVNGAEVIGALVDQKYPGRQFAGVVHVAGGRWPQWRQADSAGCQQAEHLRLGEHRRLGHRPQRY